MPQKFNKENISSCLIATIFAIILIGCDSVYIVKGTIIGLPSSMDSPEITGLVRDSASVKLSGVEVTIYYLQEKESHLIPPAKSNEAGDFIIHLVQPPPLPSSTYLKFSKEGYKNKLVYFTREKTDSTVDIKPCNKDEKRTGCWIVNVVMIPEKE